MKAAGNSHQGDLICRSPLPGRCVATVVAIAVAVATTPVVAAPAANAAVTTGAPAGQARGVTSERGASSLESAAAKAGDTGRAVAMSLIGLAFAVAGVVLAFRRDFKEAAAVFAVGIIAVLLATPTGVALLRDTVTSLFGA